MKASVCHILTALLLGLLLVSCSGKGRIIPRDIMADIYADMFIADQWLNDNSGERSKVDTSLFYDPIFERYGYTFEDYDATVKKYMEDPEKFSKVFRAAADKLKKKQNQFAKKADRVKQIREFNEAFKNYVDLDFDADTLLWTPQDTLVLDSLTLDSLCRDSLRMDSIARELFVRDSLQRDSLVRDSLIRENNRLDSLLHRRKKPTVRSRIPEKNNL